MRKVSEFASIRLPREMKRQVGQMARLERRSLSAMLKILVEEAYNARQATIRAREIASGAMERV